MCGWLASPLARINTDTALSPSFSWLISSLSARGDFALQWQPFTSFSVIAVQLERTVLVLHSHSCFLDLLSVSSAVHCPIDGWSLLDNYNWRCSQSWWDQQSICTIVSLCVFFLWLSISLIVSPTVTVFTPFSLKRRPDVRKERACKAFCHIHRWPFVEGTQVMTAFFGGQSAREQTWTDQNRAQQFALTSNATRSALSLHWITALQSHHQKWQWNSGQTATARAPLLESLQCVTVRQSVWWPACQSCLFVHWYPPLYRILHFSLLLARFQTTWLPCNAHWRQCFASLIAHIKFRQCSPPVGGSEPITVYYHYHYFTTHGGWSIA